MSWSRSATTHDVSNSSQSLLDHAPYAVQLVKQVKYGPQESIRYFTPMIAEPGFVEVTEEHLINANCEKLNSYKNFRCARHNRFFEVNLYQKNPTNKHHWRANIARPAQDIDLDSRKHNPSKLSSTVITMKNAEGKAVDSPSLSPAGTGTQVSDSCDY